MHVVVTSMNKLDSGALSAPESAVPLLSQAALDVDFKIEKWSYMFSHQRKTRDRILPYVHHRHMNGVASWVAYGAPFVPVEEAAC